MAEITIRDIAKRAGVSIKTVSRVINNENGVNPGTRARVEDVVEAMGFTPNVSARALPSRRNYLLGVIFHWVGSSDYIAQVQVGAMRAARRAGYHLAIEQAHDPQAGGRDALLASLRSGRFDGLILTPPVGDDEGLLDLLDAQGLPYVRLSPGSRPERSLHVFMDEAAAARRMVEHLLDLGHQRIGLIAGPAEHAASGLRREGYRQALQGRGVAYDPALVAEGMFDALSGFAAAEALLTLDPRPTAIFASNDHMAVGALAAAARQGLLVPQDLSVAGFDDGPAAAAAWPPLTTIHQPVSAMAETATDMLIAGFGSQAPRSAPRGRRMDFDLVVRASADRPS